MARVLVDSSVWIDFLRSGRSQESQLLEKLLQEDHVCLFDIIRAELLSGARNEPEYRMLEERLASLPLLEIPHGFWNQVALSRFRLARQGLQCSIPDIAIAVMARSQGCPLLTLDRPLMQAAKLLRVKLLQPRTR
jgi:predicted nucleic acid-binding protein